MARCFYCAQEADGEVGHAAGCPQLWYSEDPSQYGRFERAAKAFEVGREDGTKATIPLSRWSWSPSYELGLWISMEEKVAAVRVAIERIAAGV